MVGTQDIRSLLAKMEAEERSAREAAEQLVQDNAKKKADLLAKLRDEDLADVREKCRLHGFTATELKGYIKARARGRPPKEAGAPKRKYTRRARPSE